MTHIDQLISAVSVASDGDKLLATDMLNVLCAIRTFRNHIPQEGHHSSLVRDAFEVLDAEFKLMLMDYNNRDG
jgi:hypothetical protein